MNININDDEALGLINRLLERLHQADMANFCSHLQIVYVASGGQYAETQINFGKTLPVPPCVGKKKGSRAQQGRFCCAVRLTFSLSL